MFGCLKRLLRFIFCCKVYYEDHPDKIKYRENYIRRLNLARRNLQQETLV